MKTRNFVALLFAMYTICTPHSFAQERESDSLRVRSILAGGVVYMLDCKNGFGGGNVAASIGPDGILLVDDMFKSTTPLLLETLKGISDKKIRIVLNTHFHSDHIEGNIVLSDFATIIAHENLLARLAAKDSWATAQAYPHITYTDKLTLYFNGEEIQIFHLPNGHTDGDTFVYFTKSKVIHLGDTYFNGMFPAVYKSGGGDLKQLITNLEKVLTDIPDDIKLIPGHGDLATKVEFEYYVSMLKETTAIVEAGIKAEKTLDQLKQEKVLSKYDTLGDGGAQSTDEYLTMLYKLLSQ